VKLTVEAAGASKWTVSILADRWFQRWSFSGPSEQFLFEDAEVLKKIRDTFCQTVWNNRSINEIELWLLDMQTQNDVVIVLAAATNRSHTPEMLYALITFNTAAGQNLDIERFQLLKHKNYFSPETEAECLALKFVYSRETAYVYNEKMVFLVTGDKEANKIDFPTDRILSASCHNHLPLFFSRLHGFLTIGSPSDFDVDSFNFSMSESEMGDVDKFSPSITNVGNLTMYELNPDEICEENKDAVNKLKAALIYHIKRNSEKCQEVLRDLLASEGLAKTSVDSTLDRTVVTLAQDLADDTPSADPRWENVRQKYSIGSSSSMQILQQLREKSLAMSHFIEFLQATKIWDKVIKLIIKLSGGSFHGNLAAAGTKGLNFAK
jgi:nuclear pore complex protein Nup133